MTETERVRLWELLEMQRHAMLMYTSCGWFFDELSGIETVQVIQYAGRVIQLAETISGDSFEPHFLDLLQEAKSNIREQRDGRVIYEKFVKPAVVDTAKLAAHYAISSLFEEYPDERRDLLLHGGARGRISASRRAGRRSSSGARASPRASPASPPCETFGALSLGDHTISGGVSADVDEEAYDALRRTDHGGVRARRLPRGDPRDGPLFRRVHLLAQDALPRRAAQDPRHVLDATLAEDEASYRQIYERQAPLMRFVRDLHVPLPQAFQTAAAFIINTDLRRALAAETARP